MCRRAARRLLLWSADARTTGCRQDVDRPRHRRPRVHNGVRQDRHRRLGTCPEKRTRSVTDVLGSHNEKIGSSGRTRTYNPPVNSRIQLVLPRVAARCAELLEVAASCGTQEARKRQRVSRRVGDRRSPCGPVAEQDGTPPAGDGPAVARCDRSGPAPGRVASRSPDGAPPDRVPDRSSLHRVGRRGVWHRTEVLLFRGSGESARGSCSGRSARETRRGRAAETRRLQQRPGRQSDGRWN